MRRARKRLRRAPKLEKSSRHAHARPAVAERSPEAQAACDAGLLYVDDASPGLRRRGSPPRFRYVDDSGAAVRDADTIARIRSLVIPPAWTDVWISPSARGHIQATGRDKRGRKQYRYHARWREHRDADKYTRMIAFGDALLRIRSAIERDLGLPGLPREKVLATVVRLLELTHVRVGNEEYARKNGSYGLTTLLNRHVEVKGSVVTFRFRGKSGKTHVVDAKDPRVAKIVRRCEELPGQHLFEYLDDEGAVRSVGSHDVNEYIRAAGGADFSAKDFRTLAGTVLAARLLRARERSRTKAQAKRTVRDVLEVVSRSLGNTVAVCRKSYVHPAVLQAFERSVLTPCDPEDADEERAVLRIVARWELRCEFAPMDALAESV
jgi:DNA topoisomerase-1